MAESMAPGRRALTAPSPPFGAATRPAMPPADESTFWRRRARFGTVAILAVGIPAVAASRLGGRSTVGAYLPTAATDLL